MPEALTARNSRLFILFRILFNCRFYYPIYTVFFLDAGVSLAEFATLNFIWAVAIVLLEVPSGALADQLGRRTLIIASAVFMILEMACLVFLPMNAGALTFWVFALNRVLSGAAEACASGADEALVYDSLPEAGRELSWRALQAKLLRWQSMCFVVTMVVGAWLYDADLINRVMGWMHTDYVVSPTQAHRWPVVLCLISAFGTLFVALRFVTPPGEKVAERFDWHTLTASFRSVLDTARWLWRSPAPMALLCIGLLGDSFMRLFYTVSSQFYRVLEIPIAWNGWIGAVAALSGAFIAGTLEKLSKRLSAPQQYGLVGSLVFLGFLGLAHPVALWGLWAAVPFWFGMRGLHYFLSPHLNAVVPPEQRATALSFRGLSMNLAYGSVMQLFGWQTMLLSKNGGSSEAIFTQSMQVWPWAFVGCAAILIFLVKRVWKVDWTAAHNP